MIDLLRVIECTHNQEEEEWVETTDPLALSITIPEEEEILMIEEVIEDTEEVIEDRREDTEVLLLEDLDLDQEVLLMKDQDLRLLRKDRLLHQIEGMKEHHHPIEDPMKVVSKIEEEALLPLMEEDQVEITEDLLINKIIIKERGKQKEYSSTLISIQATTSTILPEADSSPRCLMEAAEAATLEAEEEAETLGTEAVSIVEDTMEEEIVGDTTEDSEDLGMTIMKMIEMEEEDTVMVSTEDLSAEEIAVTDRVEDLEMVQEVDTETTSLPRLGTTAKK